MEDQLNGKAILYVLRLIWNAIDYGGSNTFIYDSLLFNDMAEFGMPEQTQVIRVFEWLEKLKIIATQQVAGETYNRPAVVHDELTMRIPAAALHITLLDQGNFITVFRKYYGEERKSATTRPLFITYDSIAGVGSVSGRRFKLSRKNKVLFGELYENLGQWYDRKRVAAIVSPDAKPMSADVTLVINTSVTNLRKAVGLNPDQLQLKGGSIMLNLRSKLL